MCNSLSNLSNIGITLDNDSENNIRKILAGKHLIFYQVQDDAVWILRVLHSGMDVEDLDFDKSF
jgi:plasmid stabilization system protein ParE